MDNKIPITVSLLLKTVRLPAMQLLNPAHFREKCEAPSLDSNSSP